MFHISVLGALELCFARGDGTGLKTPFCFTESTYCQTQGAIYAQGRKAFSPVSRNCWPRPVLSQKFKCRNTVYVVRALKHFLPSGSFAAFVHVCLLTCSKLFRPYFLNYALLSPVFVVFSAPSSTFTYFVRCSSSAVTEASAALSFLSHNLSVYPNCKSITSW